MNHKINLKPTELGKHLLSCNTCSQQFTEIITHMVVTGNGENND